MNHRELLKTPLLAGAAAMPAIASPASTRDLLSSCGCAPLSAASLALPSAPRLKVTDMKVFGVTTEYVPPDRPHIFVKIETDAGVVGWGEATLEGKAESAIQAVKDMSYAIIGQDPMQGGASLAVDVHPRLLSRGTGTRFRHLWHRSSSLGYPRQSSRQTGLRITWWPSR